MRRLALSVVILALVVGSVTLVSPVKASTPVTAKVLVYRLNARSEPSTRASKVGLLQRNDTLTVLGQKKSGGIWFKVQTSTGLNGWVVSAFVKLTAGSLKDIPTVP